METARSHRSVDARPPLKAAIVALTIALTSLVTSSLALAPTEEDLLCRQCLMACGLTSDIVVKLMRCGCFSHCNNNSAELAAFFYTHQCIGVGWDEAVLSRFVNENKGRFIDPRKAINATVAPIIDEREPMVKSHSEGQSVCPTIYKVITPNRAEHISGMMVNLLRMKKMRQYFFVGTCKNQKPIITLHPSNRCTTIKTHHKAIFTVSDAAKERASQGMSDCRLYDYRKRLYVCDDWVRLNASCSFQI